MLENFATASTVGQTSYPKSSKLHQYGTAGFRDKAKELPHVMYRMGLLAVLRSKFKNGQTVGLMITASHNPEEDNGIKLCDPDGTMLEKEWELFATDLVNSEDGKLSETLVSISNRNNINYDIPASIYLARDTRSSSISLSKAAIDGIHALGGEAKDYGLLTTPQLHFVVCCKNYSSYGTPTVEGYYNKLSNAFEAMKSQQLCKKYVPTVYVDGANGIGALKVKDLQKHLKTIQINIFNDGSSGILNYKCGADYVKIDQRPPEGCNLLVGKRYSSFDGDADRLVYYYQDENRFNLLDGDKIATLFAKFFKELVELSGVSCVIRVIQTAYANGSSTSYIENVLNIPVICVPTGVKHLHHEALKYDIGVYFEANGHGTVVFSDEVKQKIKDVASKENESIEKQVAAQKLLSAIDIINETVGDAISDLLLSEAILLHYDWDIENWDALYTDYPNRQLKVKVHDRQAIVTADAERKCVKPEGLQDAINDTVVKYKNSRSFVRPSGTEDIVRVYAEALTRKEADSLAEEVSLLVKKFT